MKKILWIGDGVVPTGFSTVNHNIIKHLPREEFEVHHLAINYWGDPHEYNHFIYPAATPNTMAVGDVMGFNRIAEFVNKDIDLIFILNDIWVVAKYLKHIKDFWKAVNKPLPKIVVYYPVDGAGCSKDWFVDFDVVNAVVVYTEFGKQVTEEAAPNIKPLVIPHGAANKDAFHKLDLPKKELKLGAYRTRPDLAEDSFIVLNANRNQPRKRIDISLLGFALFSKDKPENVMYHHHAGIVDVGWHIIDLVRRLEKELNIELEKRIILTNSEVKTQKVPMSELNLIYNASDVGINTSLGEGWGLVQTEQASLGIPQIVGDHTACKELFDEFGYLIPVESVVRDRHHLLKRYFVSAEGLADQLDLLYNSKDAYYDFSKSVETKFQSPYYQWENIGQIWTKLFKEILT